MSCHFGILSITQTVLSNIAILTDLITLFAKSLEISVSSFLLGMSEDSSQFVLAPDGLIQTSQTFDCEIENRYFIIIIACDKGDPSR